jgi:hypothetical protein
MSKHPVGPKAIERASRTKPGQLAVLLNEILYHADTKVVTEGEHKYSRFVCTEDVYISSKINTESTLSCTKGKQRAATEAILQEIRDYLEWVSIREVVE